MDQVIENHYDVVIVGASFAGLSCARELAKTKKNVLVLDKNYQPGTKACGYGVEDEDLLFVPESYLNYPMSSLYIEANGKKIQMPRGRGLISSIVRSEIINDWIKDLNTSSNIRVEVGCGVKNINRDNKYLLLENNKQISFDHLVGADGYFSIVRKSLGLSVDEYMVAIHYLLSDHIAEGFLMAEDWELFGKGYAWIFPNKSFASVGCAVDCKSKHVKELHNNLKKWLAKKNIDYSKGKFEGSIINYDFRGYKFGDIYLVGDAAGFADGLTGKGIYAACLSGHLVAEEIIGSVTLSEKMNDWLEEKKKNEKILHHQDKNFLELKMSLIEKSQ